MIFLSIVAIISFRGPNCETENTAGYDARDVSQKTPLAISSPHPPPATVSNDCDKEPPYHVLYLARIAPARNKMHSGSDLAHTTRPKFKFV